MDNKKIFVVALIVVLVIVAVFNVVMIRDMNKTEIVIPEEYTLESNESGVETYVNNLDNGYKLEIKEDTNPNGIKRENMYGSIMKCDVNGKNYIITCYNPVDESKEVSPYQTPLYDLSDVKAHPGVKPVECVHQSDAITFPSIMTQKDNPYDIKTLSDMNKTGNLHASGIQQYFPSTYTDACKIIKDRDDAYLLNRYYGI